MAKPKRRKSNAFPPPAELSTIQRPVGPAYDAKPKVRWELVALFLTIALGGTYLAISLRPKNDAPRFTFEVKKKYKHDEAAFTQGLLVDGGFLWESTGRNGQSTVRKIDLESGEVLLKTDLDKKYFGEGLTFHKDKLYQLTWKNNQGFVYDRELKQIGKFEYKGQGWGLTSDGDSLIMSNGTAELRFLDPETFEIRRTIRVRRGGVRVGRLNELEYVAGTGKIYANVYQTDFIYEIDPQTGDVTSLIDLSGMWPMRQRPADGVLNGIAFNDETRRLLVTGKLCPTIYEIDLIPED